MGDYPISSFLSAAEISKKIDILARDISRDYHGKTLMIIGLMKGCLFFLSDLVRRLEIELHIEIIYAVSYKKRSSTGNVELLLDLREDIFNRHVLIVDDIVDTGITLNKIRELMLSRSPASLEFGVLFDKIECRTQDINIKYRGFVVPNLFFVGYGMDYDGRFRQLPYLGVLQKDFS